MGGGILHPVNGKWSDMKMNRNGTFRSRNLKIFLGMNEPVSL